VLRHEVVSVLLLVWINASLRSVDVAFAILSNRLWLLDVESILLNITILILDFSSVINCDMFIGVLLVHFRQMLLSKIKNLVSDVTNVPFFWSLFNFITNYRVLLKDFFQQELLFKLHGLHILFSSVDKLTLFIEADVVIANVRILIKLDRRISWILTRSLDHAIVSNCYSSFLDEIHVCDFIFFI
jgi:hypothetical protein